MQNYKAALARGGEATFHVVHDHGAGNFQNACRGWLHVSRNGVHFEAFDSLHKFSASRSQVHEAKKNRWQGVLLNDGSGRQAPDMHPFHIRLQSSKGPNYNFAPMSNSGDAERGLILDIIDK
jgi:hypothetical protein